MATASAQLEGECAAHPGTRAEWTCQRCGSFVCTQCERRTRPDAPPLCPKCWELRAKAVHEVAVKESRKVQITGLVLGVFSIHPLIMIASLILNVRGLVKDRTHSSRWMNVVGLSLTGVWMFVWLVGITWGALH